MSRLFNISSAGSTASAWLTINLNKHPLITAFHGLRQNPFGSELIHPDEMVAGLSKLAMYLSTIEFSETNQSGEKPAIGIIHTYYGPEPRPHFIKSGGGFMAIIRDPVLRVNSQFLATYDEAQKIPNTPEGVDIYDFIRENGQLGDVEEAFPGFVRDTTKGLSPANHLFFNQVETALRNDVLNFQKCPADEIILFEEMVSSVDYCFGKLSAVTGVDDDELKRIIADNMSVKANRHTKGRKTSSDIFENWPEQFKFLFRAAMEDIGVEDCLKAYRDLGYLETTETLEKYVEASGTSVTSSTPPADDLPVQQMVDSGVAHHTAGRLKEAEEVYRKILEIDPEQPVALHLSGILAHQKGQPETAIELIGKAVSVKPDYAEAHNNLGNIFKQLGRLEEAVEVYQKALEHHPGFIEPLNSLGSIYMGTGRQEQAVAIYQELLSAGGESPEIRYNIGLALQALNKMDVAISNFQQALVLKPQFAEAHFSLGNAFLNQGHSDKAIDAYRKALDIEPNFVDALNNLGLMLSARGDFNEALSCFQKAIDIKPDYAMLHNNMGVTFQDLRLLEESVASCRRAVDLDPTYAEAQNNLANALHDLGSFGEAASCYEKALSAKPDYADAHSNRGNTLKELGKLDEARDSFLKALSLKPDFQEAHSSLIFLQDLLADVDQKEQQEERGRWDKKFIAPLKDKIHPHDNDPSPERRLRVGYVSADFRRHSASQGFAPLILNHDKTNFEVICYDATPVLDDFSQHLKDAAAEWRDVRFMNDRELADTIRADGIDILVDLSGHTRGNRLTAFGYKPAPLQVTGIGHLAPGLSTIDYRLTSPFMTPPAEDIIYPEQPIYLHTYFGFMPPVGSPPIGPAPCLQNTAVTFGFLGRQNKISPETLATWANILHDLPESRFLLKHNGLNDPQTRQQTLEEFARLGISEDRLILLGKTKQPEHLEAHNRVDIVLDTFPHGGGITALESLWMGVPVIGMADAAKTGGRIIEAINQPLGLDGWIAKTIDDYHDIALEGAGKPEELAELRQALRQRVSDVYSRFPGDVEKAYREIWKRWCDKTPPAPFYTEDITSSGGA